MWPDQRLIELTGIELPIIQAPMAGASGPTMAIAVSRAGGLGSLPCAMLGPDEVRQEIEFTQSEARPLNMNFFCHTPPELDPGRDERWKKALAAYYYEVGVDAPAFSSKAGRTSFDKSMCGIVEEYRPEVVSFHFGLPPQALLDRVKGAGCLVISSATTVEEARWLEGRGCDAIIAQGSEAGGHRGMFLTGKVATQVGTFALVPQIVDAVRVPVIAAGGIADGRGIAAAFALGASGVQIGTAFLFTPESLISPLHRAALSSPDVAETALTNLFSGRPARGIVNRLMQEVGPLSDLAPEFPMAGHALAPLKAWAEANGKVDFSAMWTGQAAGLCHRDGAGDLTRRLARDAIERMESMATT